MNAAKLSKSDRLKRVLNLLKDGMPKSTWQIIQVASVCAVNSIVAELRANGKTIDCYRVKNVWYYQLKTKRRKS